MVLDGAGEISHTSAFRQAWDTAGSSGSKTIESSETVDDLVPEHDGDESPRPLHMRSARKSVLVGSSGSKTHDNDNLQLPNKSHMPLTFHRNDAKFRGQAPNSTIIPETDDEDEAMAG